MSGKSIRSQLEELDEEYENDEVVEYLPYDEEEKSYVFYELLAGITVISLIAIIVVLCIPSDRIYHLVGLLVGIAIAYFMICHMNYTTWKAVNLDEESAKKYLMKHYIYRMVVVFIAMTTTFATGVGNIILILVGIMSLKVAVYIQPFTDKLFKKIMKKGG